MNIILAGASGLIGTKLIKKIKQNNISLIKLTTNKLLAGLEGCCYWNPSESYIDTSCFKGNDVIINLSGAGIFDRRWTASRKKLLYNSRIDSTHLLYDTVSARGDKLVRMVNASAIGIYENCLGKLQEDSTKGTSFIADICAQWEAEVYKFYTLNVPVTIARIGIVLDPSKGFLARLARPIRMGIGAIPGTGNQMVSWIHIEDVVNFLFEAAVAGRYPGTYNLVAPEPVTMAVITEKVSSRLGKRLWLPHIPGFILRCMLGERVDLIMASQDVSCAKLQAAGFQFKYPTIDLALRDLTGEAT